MARFTLERVIRATPTEVFAAALDPALHVESMARYDETMVKGPDGGVFTEGSTVTWRARHFGVPFHLSSVVFDIDPPRRFCDRQAKGPFGAFHHEHVFEVHPQGTLMRDTITFRSPFGPIGALVDRLFMREYMRRLIDERGAVLATALER
ncbi:SRPBCC family protein [Microbacterium sp. AK031]|uniref:SRPBCC family protein n=1 Tax=Microbacterium sp. AK031 TaxID=2723076 RepID=UPI002167E330|nr:SRPBCC family protein [Microbacterium sp. AK031]MCS3843080.1 ligand-binding SRPBCC domain-containing protein [Microbacterium sp. AK031]